MHSLSKSKLMAFRQCPKRLWLEIHRPDLRDDSGAESKKLRIGNEFREAARRVYDPEGRGTHLDVAEMGFEGALGRSAFLLRKGEGPVFNACLQGEGGLDFMDVMLPAVSYGALIWRLLEVKSTGVVKDYHRDDLLIQVYLANEIKVPLTSVGIVYIDHTFIYLGDGDYRGLFNEVDFTVDMEWNVYDAYEWVEEAREVAHAAEEPATSMGPQCSHPYDCPFTGYCLPEKQAVEYPLSSLPFFSSASREIVEALGITDLREVPDLHLTDLQRHFRDVTISGETWFDAAGAAAALKPHDFPARFLGFETVIMPVPIWKGTRPFQQIPYQFSLHGIDEEGGLSHGYFLDLSGEDPSRDLARTLVIACGEDGPVYVYDADFERRVIRELGQRFPDFAPSLQDIANRLVDLLLIAKDHFYHPSQHGNWSLKAVFSAACPDISYNLDGVADGRMAGDAFREAIAKETTPERRVEIERQLLAYCHLDTMAMVRVWEVFQNGQMNTESSRKRHGLF